MAWWKRNEGKPLLGSVLFRGSLPPKAQEFASLAKLGINVRPADGPRGSLWGLDLRHDEWGQANLACFRDLPTLPAHLVDLEPRLLAEEKQQIRSAGCAIGLMMTPGAENILRDRKNFLRFAQATMGSDGLGVVDHKAQAMWSPAALAEELSHNADLDIISLFTTHWIYVEQNERKETYWIHTHGMKELGFFDFDILGPCQETVGNHNLLDTLRAMAFIVAEGKAKIGGAPVEIAPPEAVLQFVTARRFMKTGGHAPAAWRAQVDEEHIEGHAVVCDPPRRRLLGLMAARPQPATFFARELPEDLALQFSDDATALMAERAKKTFGVFVRLRKEFAELELPSLVKMCYKGKGPNGRNEHLWFEVHDADEGGVNATLVNKPWQDIGMQMGDRRRHAVDALTDWTIFTPVGSIDPRFMKAARSIRIHIDEIKQMMQEAKPARQGAASD
jgi:uncharacterized protein YegJ (DUF2314 family)